MMTDNMLILFIEHQTSPKYKALVTPLWCAAATQWSWRPSSKFLPCRQQTLDQLRIRESPLPSPPLPTPLCQPTLHTHCEQHWQVSPAYRALITAQPLFTSSHRHHNHHNCTRATKCCHQAIEMESLKSDHKFYAGSGTTSNLAICLQSL